MNFLSVLKREKRTIIIFLIEIGIPLFIFVGIPLGIYILSTHEDTGKVIRESYWGIVLPTEKEMDEILRERTETGFHGESLRHSIYVVERNEIKFNFGLILRQTLKMHAWNIVRIWALMKSICRISRRNTDGANLKNIRIRLFWCIS